MGAAGVAAGGALAPAGTALVRGRHGSIHAVGTVAVTTEALTVTLLTEVLRRANQNSVPAGDLAVFEGAYAAEVDHFRFTRKYWNPTTTKFWIPDRFFGGAGNTLDLTALGMALVARRDAVRRPLPDRGHCVCACRQRAVRAFLGGDRRS